ncbi:MAG: phosphomannomutase [Sulfurimonas sp.]|nr:MAG: phosphomannomutase [Sulfurimonas sp.]
MKSQIKCFKAYDVRGRIPDELNEDIAYRIGRAYAEVIQPKKVVVGYDIRLSSHELCTALTAGLTDAGVDVYNIGMCGTEEIYFATFAFDFDGGIVVTASHNPMDFNGMKFVKEQAKPISSDTGLLDIKAVAEKNDFATVHTKGKTVSFDHRKEYIDHLLSYIDVSSLKSLKIVVNAGNGGAGMIVDLLEPHLPFEFIKVHHEPDGNFPNGIPNPILPENRSATAEAVVAHGADVGLAWDGDFDRCFFFDETGSFIEGYYIVGLLAQSLLEKQPGHKIIHDPRLTYNTVDIVNRAGGDVVQSKSGHAFIKERMRQEDAIYGGEMSAHHYFKDFAYCDSGMIPWLLVTELLAQTGKKMSELVNERIAQFPSSGEINSSVADAAQVIEKIKKRFEDECIEIDYTDGLSMEFETWRFNLRSSNTEPLLRLNVESRADAALMQEKTEMLLALIR